MPPRLPWIPDTSGGIVLPPALSRRIAKRRRRTKPAVHLDRPVNDLTCRLTGALSPREHLPGKAPTAQLTRIDAANRLFSVPLTRITSVPQCAVSSVGFLWGSAAVSRSCGVFVGRAEAPDWPGRPGTGYPSPADFGLCSADLGAGPGAPSSPPGAFLQGGALAGAQHDRHSAKPRRLARR
jgi:hypothetical protein